MSKQKMKQQEPGMRNLAQNNRGGKEANPAKDAPNQKSTKGGQQSKTR